MTRGRTRIMAVILAVGLTLTAVGCSSSSAGTQETTAAGTQGTAGTAAQEPATAAQEPATAAQEAGVSGSFEGTAQGFGGEVKVTLTLENGILTGVSAEGADETPDVGGRALELMPAAMAAANSIEVDGVAGASLTSKAIREAAESALTASGAVLTGQTISVEQHMTPGTYIGEAYGKWKEGSIEGERFGSPAVIVPMKVSVTVDKRL